MNEEIKHLEEKIDDMFQKLTDKQNSQYTDIMMKLKEIHDSQDEDVDVEGRSEDELYEEAKNCVIESRKASTSWLQRKLGVGYARACGLIDMLEDNGVIGPGSGVTPREVLIKHQ